MATPEHASHPANEAALAARWAQGMRGPLRLADGRPLHVVFPGVPGGGSGPDFRDAIVEVDGGLLRGDVEIHLETGGWRAHGHADDPAYANVVLHVVATGGPAHHETVHGSGRRIPVLVAPPERVPFPPPFTPPCTFAAATGGDINAALARLTRRRLRQKAARSEPVIKRHGMAQGLYLALLDIFGGPANRDSFHIIGARLPRAALLEAADGMPDRPLALSAHLKAAARDLPLRRAGMRPAARPERRLEALARLIHRLWPQASGPAWPVALTDLGQHARAPALVRLLRVEGFGQGLAIECWVNAVLPVGVASMQITEDEALNLLSRLPSPGTYGVLRPLEGWLGGRPFRSAGLLQGGLLLHRDYCAKGRCGRCPLSSGMTLGACENPHR